MKLSPSNFNRFLQGDVVQSFGWSKSYACPCFNPNSGAAKPGCPICNGKGRLWAAEVIDSAAMTGMSQKRGFANFGTWEPGDALLTIPCAAAFYDVAQFDKFRALNSTHQFSENLTHGVNDALTGTVALDPTGVPLVYRVFWLSPDGTTIIDGEIPVVGAGGALTWPDGGGPPDGVQFSVTYSRYDVFYVYLDLASNRNSGANGLPKKIMVRSFDLFGR